MVVENKSTGRKLFISGNYIFLILLGFLCLFPTLHVLAISFSSSAAADAGLVLLWPVDFTLEAYQFVANKPEFLQSVWVSIQRELLAIPISMIISILLAYALSKEARDFPWRTFYVWVFVFSMLFHGGLIPTYLVVKNVGFLDSIWALVLPNAVVVFNVILLLNFFRSLPRELLEAAYMDGAGQWKTLWKIVLPISLPGIATVTLFVAVFHWNQWFDGIIFMNDPEHYPLQSYLQTVVVASSLTDLTLSDLEIYANLSQRNVKAAQIFLGALPILCIYPFLQRYFMSGIVMGSVKE